MRSIFKYDVSAAKGGIIEGPITKLLTAQVQHGSIMVWAEVDTDAENVKYEIVPVGTGWPLDASTGKCVLDTHQYLGTVQLAGGTFVFHVYAKKLVTVNVAPTNKKANPIKAKVKMKNEKDEKVTICAINPKVLAQFI
jgi:hypothetical protein